MITGVANVEAKRLPMSPVKPIVFVVDDDISVRESLAGMVQYLGRDVETFASAEEFLARPPVRSPSCLLLDISLPDLNGLELQERIAIDRIDMPIIFITGHGDIPMTVRAMKAGAVEFLTKPLDREVLSASIENALARSSALIDEAAELAALRARYASLSGREREVMALVASGKMNKQIAGELGISEITVKVHRGRVMRKMRARTLVDLVRIAASLHLAPEENGST
jgi:FixJ family two-component response regulator